ncbi:MAG TPA: type II secretion system F family protein [Mycobacteriales bacterium]|nr:type II secretion system F family protein [Mycobacteriales bacterium]
MTLWLAAAAVGLVVALSMPRSAAHRLARWRPATADRPARIRTIRGADLAVAVAIGSALVALHLPLFVAMAGGLLPLGWAKLRQGRAGRRIRAAREAAVAEVTFALAGELRAGRTAGEALRAAAATAGPLADVLRSAAASVAIGGSAAAELDAASRLPGAERLRSVAAAWRVTESAGGKVALVLERLGEAMDRDDELRREMQSALASPKATSLLLAGLPVFGIALGQAIGAHPLHLLLYQPLGWGLLAGAAVLDAIGIAVTRRISSWALQC